MFEKPRNLNLPAEIGAVLTETGFDPVEFMVLIGDQRVKDRLKENTTRAVARGAFETVIAGIAHNAKSGTDRPTKTCKRRWPASF